MRRNATHYELVDEAIWCRGTIAIQVRSQLRTQVDRRGPVYYIYSTGLVKWLNIILGEEVQVCVLYG